MLNNTIITLFKRDLEALKKEINLYSKEENMWLLDKSISNSTGNLCLHLVGNLNHFIGAALGNTGYIRQRELEFSIKNVSKQDLLKQIDDTIPMIEKALNPLTDEDLQQEYKHRVFENSMTTEFFLVHLAMHLAYHLGQVNYHRRILDI